MDHALRVAAALLGIIGLVFFAHGLGQTGVVTDALLLSVDAWNDPKHGLTFLVLGGIVLAVSMFCTVVFWLRRIELLVTGQRQRTRSEPTVVDRSPTHVSN